MARHTMQVTVDSTNKNVLSTFLWLTAMNTTSSGRSYVNTSLGLYADLLHMREQYLFTFPPTRRSPKKINFSKPGYIHTNVR